MLRSTGLNSIDVGSMENRSIPASVALMFIGGDSASKLLVIALMFVGRIGPMLLATALAIRTGRRLYRYPEGRPLVG